MSKTKKKLLPPAATCNIGAGVDVVEAFHRAAPDERALIVAIVEAVRAVSAKKPTAEWPYMATSAILGMVANDLPWLLADAKARCRASLDAMDAKLVAETEQAGGTP